MLKNNRSVFLPIGGRKQKKKRCQRYEKFIDIWNMDSLSVCLFLSFSTQTHHFICLCPSITIIIENESAERRILYNQQESISICMYIFYSLAGSSIVSINFDYNNLPNDRGRQLPILIDFVIFHTLLIFICIFDVFVLVHTRLINLTPILYLC